MDTKKKKIVKITGIVAVVLMLLCVIGISIYKQTEKVSLQGNPEIRRSMEYQEVQEGDENTNSQYVQFDAFFLRDLDGDGYAESIRGTCRDISETDTLYMDINVLTNGTLKNGKITINAQNINLQTALVEDNVVKNNYISNNTTTIELKDMKNGTQKLMYGTIKASSFGNDTTKYSKINSITLTGTHVADDGVTETQINKTVDFTVDWHGDVQTSIYNYSGTQNIENIVDDSKQNMTLSFSVTTRENIDELILKDAVLEGTLPEINGYKPISVEIPSKNMSINYNEETRTFTLKKESTLGSNGIVSNTVSSSNTFSLKVTYPYEAYESLTEDILSIQVPVKAYYEGYNNPNPEFENPIKSNIAERTITFLWRKYQESEPVVSPARFDVTIGTYRSYDNKYVISKEEPLKLYNGTATDTEDLYKVIWEAYTGNQVSIDSIQMKETQTPYSDRFLNNTGTYFNMSDYTSNVGIYFTGAENTLGENGYIKVINDETGEEIHTFTKDDWGNYNSSNPYKYESPVKHIRIETSKANQNSSLYVYNVKEIDDNVLVETFTREEFDKLQNIYTYLTGGIKQEGSSNYTSVNDIASAIYEAPMSVAILTVNRDTIGTQTKEENINLTIDAQTTYYNIKGWKNAKFLIELPQDVLDVEINNINISNSNVKILAYEIYEKNGQKFIRVETENENEETYKITINTNLTADPRAITQTTNVKLYGYNEACDNYRQNTQDIYDIDVDENLQEKVNYSTDNLYLVSPSSLLTNQQATDYNEAKETAIAPQIATIDKVEADTAKVNISITNNYQGTISDVTILGKIPFDGNSFIINGTDLGSNFTSQMLNEGITVPNDIKDKVTIYYSENENPTNDINNPQNGWTTTPDFSKVKTYLIDLGDYVLQTGENRVFSYKIKVPSTVQYNDVSYSTHAVYFCLDTDQGKYRTQTETSKLGFRIERKYNFNIQKLKEDTQVPVQGAIFSITVDGEDETRIGTTNNSGNISIENLYVDKTYTLKEIRTPGSYESLEGDIQFRVSVENDELVLNILKGQNIIKNYNIEQATTDTRGTINLVIENTPKYKLEITKKDSKTGDVLQGVKYKLEGEGLGTGIIVATDKEGKLILAGLSQGVEYTLTETEAKGYYVSETPVKFKVENNSGKLNFVVISGSFASNSQIVTGTGITGLDAQDTVTAELTDEKIPTYQVQLKKFAKDEDMILKGAQYIITGEGIDEKGETYITDENGVLTIPNLYEYVEGKYITGVYTIKEITPPEGYALDERELQFRATRNDQGNLELEIIGENFLKNSSVENADNENAVINIELEDEPLFKITKVDETTKTPIPNAKFVIYEIDESYSEIGYAKDINGNQIGTVENGVPVVETNENGEISYGLKSGLYKAVEVEAPEGYELPENEEDRTYYFGIDASKAQESTFGTSIMDQVSGTNWEKIESVDNTSDNGFVISGYFVDNADFNKDGVTDIKVNSSEWSGFIAKYDEEGNLEFAKPVYTLDGETKLHKIIQTNDEGYVAVGYYTGSTLTVGDVNTGLTNTGANKKALVVKFGSSGNYEWSKEVEVSGTDVEATALGQNLQGNVLVGITKTTENAQVVEYSSINGNVVNDAEIPAEVKVTGIEGENNQEAVIVSQGLTDTTTGRIDTYQDGNITEKMTLDFNANDVTRLENGKYVIVGNYTGTAQGTTSEGNYDGIISVYDMNSNIIESSKFIEGTSDDIVASVKSTTYGGYIVGGYTYSNRATCDEFYVQQGSFVLKYSQDGTPEWQKEIWGDNYNEVTDVTERDENEFVVVGYFNSSSVNSDSTDRNSLSLTQYTDSFIFNYGEIVTAPEIPESSQITVNNNLKKYKITTDVEEVNGAKGGSISGEDEQPYETVEYGKDSTKEIKMIPNTGYKVVKITINGENYGFTTEEDGSVILPNFTNMTSDKHVVVTFSNTASSVVVHHYIDDTEISVAPDENLSGNIGDYYTTAPKMDLEKYELKKVDGEYEIPDNASGIYTEKQQVVTYYYVKKQVAITVQHLIEGTDEKVPLASGEPAQDETLTGEIGTEYTTDALTPEELSPKYELSIIPDNQNGVYTNDETVVIYYYKAKNVEVTTEVKTHKETNAMGEEVDVKGGSISGEGQTPYETVIYGEDSQKDIVITPDENYQVKEILVNDEPIIFSTEEDGTVTLDKFIDMLEDKHVVVEFEKIPATVIVHHYIENTTDKVPSVDGGTVQDETKQGVVGDIYATKEAENVAPNYELVEVPENSSGTMTKDIIVVIYYYKLKDPNIETPVITKESGVEKVTNVSQSIDYNINYSTTIDTYKGDAIVTIVDTLPYEIDEEQSNIAGGVYNSDNKTITWTEKVAGIDTFANDAKKINITKEITLVYKNIDTAQNSILNKVTGKVELKTPEKEETVEDEKEIPAEYFVNIEVNKVWNDNNNAAQKRPSAVNVVVKNGTEEVEKQELNNENKWTCTFKNLSKYDDLGKVINYTVEEQEVNSGDLYFYDTNVSGSITEGFTITNTFTVPGETVSVDVSKMWVDTAEQKDKRPTGVTVVLKNGDTEAGRQELNGGNNWKYTFANLAKYDNLGNVINYTVEEVTTNKFYTSSTAGDMTKGYTITNTFTVPNETVDIPVTKVWADNNNEAQKRPANVTLKVTGNGETYKQLVTSENEVEGDTNTWTYTFKELPKYDANGDEIKYAVDEEKINNEFYQKVVDQGTRTITNTFEVPGEKVTVEGKKVWNDNQDEVGKRPLNVTLQIKNGNEIVASEVVSLEDNWTAEFTVPKYDSLGNVINYTVDEADLGSIFYSKENVTGNMTEGYTITNKFQVPGDTVEIPVTKVWNDNGDSANKRPANVTLKLTGSDGQEYKQDLSSKNEVEENTNNWTYTFTGLPKYDAKGNVITYTLSEEPTGSIFYTEQNTVVDQESKTITNTFEVPDDKIEIPVTKVWNDNGDSANKRPTNVTLKLTGSDGQEYKQDLSSKNEVEENTNNWTYTFTELPKYDAKGNVITYTLREEPTGSIFYTEANTDITGDMTNGYIVTNTFEVPGDTVSVDVNKVWVDTAKQQNKRPTGVTVVLKNGVEEAGIQELNSGNNWTYTFKNLAKYDSLGNEINYTVEEVTTNKFYTSSTAGDMASGYTITNTFTVPNETVDIPVTKVWADNNNEAGKRSLSVTLKVTGNGKIETQVITSANANKEDNNTWTYTFKGLQKYDENGDEIEYTVDEENLNNEFYQKVVDQGTRTITNIFEVPGEKVTVKATKVWNDNNDEAGKRPLNVTLQIKNGNAVVASEVVDAQDNWTAEFTVPKYDSLGNAINYTVDEADLGNMFYIKENVTGDMTSGFTITNTFEVPEDTVSVDVTKVWEDTEKQQDKRPTGVTVVLKDGDTEAGRQELNSGNNWTYTFKNLAKYDSLGNEINYTVEEVTTNKFYTSSIEGDMTKGYTITNTFTVPNETVDIPVTKIWNHGGNKGEKPQEITLQVKNGQEVVRQAKVTESDGWKYTFEDLPKYDENGNEIKYTADEKENLAEYKKSIDGLTVTNTYNGAVITGSKLAKTEKNNGYVVAGEKITYTITVRNAGGLAKEVIVKDTAPEGTTFVEGSIKVDNEVQEVLAETDLQNGISVNVPAKTEAGEGETRVSFEVTVNEEATGEIRNAGTIKESETVEEETNEVTTPVVKISKTSEVQRKTEGTLGANEVTAGDEITYKIKVENTSNTDIKDVEIEDSIPEGTSLKQINDNGMQEGNIIKWQIDVDKNSSVEVSFVVTVDYEGKDGSIKNVATVDGNETNETDNPYKKQEAKVESSITKDGEEEITTVDEKVYYEINYEATIEDHVGSATVTIVDKLPYRINAQESELAGGKYDAEEKTITWEENIANIDTYKANAPKKITITKAISLKYDYGDIDEIGENLTNEVVGKIELKEGDEVTKTDEVTAEHTEKIKIPAKVIVHHYIYDEETDEYTEEKIAEDETKNGIVGESYSTTKSNSVPQNYECINETPEKYQGKMTYEDTEVTYYYKLKESSITSTIEKTASANKIETQEDGTELPVLTNERGVVTYNIKYNAEVNDCIGKVKIIVIDSLPAAIDEASSDLAGGKYDSKNNTITWEEEVSVDTFTNGKYTHNFNKVVKLVYVDQDVTEDLVNIVNGETKIYYPDNYPEKGGEEVKTDEDETTSTVKQEYKVDKNVEKIWEDNNNSKGKRPSSVMIELTADGEVVENSQVELNSRNGWKHTYRELEKYDEIGREIEYSIIETEKNPGDLEYYEEPEIGGTNDIIVTNKYKLKETALKSDITKETETVITASNQEVPYTIHYEAEIDEYIGDAVVTIVDELPYKIDEEKSNLDGGIYNEELQTITWIKELGHINTDTLGEAYKVDITKNIILVYKDLDATQSRVTNKVVGTVELYETEEKNTVEAEEVTQVEIEGTVIVKYVEKETGKELETAEEMTGRVGEEYITLPKDIENYTLVGDTENTRGEYKEGAIEVIYYYEKTPAKVIIKYEDEEGKDLLPERVVEGYVSQEYETKAEEIEEYELKEVIGQEKGEMTKDDIVIIYVYKKKEAGGVIVHYIDKETGEKLAEDEVIEGNIGDEYKTERKVIENYQKAEPEPTNKEGTMTEETIEVTYYYERIPSGKITVKCVDKDTKEEITYEDETGEEKTYGYEIKGYVGEEYITEEKEIPYYKIVENMLPINREGILSQNDETVTYYYEKMKFNMEISKRVKTVTIKGEEKEVSNGSLTKVEIHRKEITTTPVEIRYVITVSNTGEIEGTGEVIEKIPEGFEVSSNNPSEWIVGADGTMKYAVELKAGESKDIEVVLKWKASETNFGEKKNVALLTNIENPAGFDEDNTEDNEAEATVIVTVATGKEVSILIIVLGFIASAGSLVLCYEYELYRKERNQPVRVVKLEGKNVVIKKEVQK